MDIFFLIAIFVLFWLVIGIIVFIAGENKEVKQERESSKRHLGWSLESTDDRIDGANDRFLALINHLNLEMTSENPPVWQKRIYTFTKIATKRRGK